MKRSFKSREYIEDDDEDDSAITDVRDYYLGRMFDVIFYIII